jgi:hypothetical protein
MSIATGGYHSTEGSDPLQVLIDTGNATRLRNALDDIGIDVPALDRMPRWNVDGDTDTATFRADLERRKVEVRQTLIQAMQQAKSAPDRPYAVLWLLAYMAYECDATWEVSYHFEPIWDTLAGARAVWTALGPWQDQLIQDAGEMLLDQLDDVFQGIHAENAMNCGFLRVSGDYYVHGQQSAGRGLTRARALLRQLANATTARERAVRGAAMFVEDWTAASVVYDEACGLAAHSIARFLEDGTGLDAASLPLRQADDELLQTYREAENFPGDVQEGQDWSELHAHRLDIAALHASRGDPWLYVDDGTIVYIYPFALRQLTDTAGRAGEDADDATAADPLDDPNDPNDYYEKKIAGCPAEVMQWVLAGITPATIHLAFRLDDVWHSTDPSGRRFDGVRVELPEVYLRANSGGDPLATLRAEIRLSKLGNHYVRFEGRLRDESPLDMYMALLRPAPEHGALVVDFKRDEDGAGGEVADEAPGSPPRSQHHEWPRLANLAMELIADLAQHLHARRTAREGMFQVLLTIDAVSTRVGPAGTTRSEVTSIPALQAAAGAPILFTPVSNVMSSLAEWSRYLIPEGTLLPRPQARAGRALVRTVNTTVHIAIGAPHWELSTALSVSEFAATLEGLFARWMEQLSDFQKAVNFQRRIVHSTKDASADKLRLHVDALRRIRLDLQTFVTDCRSTVTLIRSPALVRSPMVAADLAAMVEAAGVRRRAEEFDQRAREVLSDRLDEIIERLANEREEAEAEAQHEAEGRHRVRMDTLLAIIAAVGVSGLGQILQAGYGLSGRSSLEITGAIVGLALVVGIAVYLGARAAHASVERAVERSRARDIARAASERAIAATAAAHEGAAVVPKQRRRALHRASKSTKRYEA